MSSIVVAGDVSGSVTLSAPSAAGSTVLTLPATSGTVLTSATPFSNGQGPAFSAYRNGNQTGISSGADTKVQINAENFDTNNNFDSSTNYRFTPTVAGYYQVNANIACIGTNLTYSIARLFKNNLLFANGNFSDDVGGEKNSVLSTLVYLNGSTDYIELYSLSIVGSGTITLLGASPERTTFSAAMVRNA